MSHDGEEQDFSSGLMLNEERNIRILWPVSIIQWFCLMIFCCSRETQVISMVIIRCVRVLIGILGRTHVSLR